MESPGRSGSETPSSLGPLRLQIFTTLKPLPLPVPEVLFRSWSGHDNVLPGR